MVTSIASQLQALKSVINGGGVESLKRPITRPSILYDPKEAADIDIDTIFSISLSGLELLINTDERFRNYKNDLFSLKSREVDRELLTNQENVQINSSISLYLRLLSGYLELLSAVKTLEYLIRRYKIHVYNAEDLILCALPYHDTHTFVKIVQLIPSGNNMWKFLDGVRETGAPPPRQVIVQQCIRDMGVMEALCNSAKATKKFQPSRPVIGLCTSVIVEVIRSVKTLEGDMVTRILPYVVSGLQPGAKRDLDQQAGALMIISSLADKVELSPSLVKSLIRTLSDVARVDGKVLADVQWVRLSIMTLINLVQLQSVETIPRKALDSLNEIRNFPMILSGLSKDFNVDKFLAVMLDSFIEYSLEDDRCLHTLVSTLENVPIKFFIDRVVNRVFAKISRNKTDAVVTGSWAKQILASIYKKYPSELRGSIRKVLKSKKESLYHEIVCQMLDGSSDPSHGISDSKIWFALEHPRAEVRRNTLSGLDVKEISSIKCTDLQRFGTIKDALLRRLHDEDLGVVREVLKLEGLFETISSPCFLDALQDVLRRCVGMLMQSTPNDKSLTIDVAVSCLQSAISNFRHHDDNLATLAKMAFPLILVLPKTWKLNLKTLEIIKELNWPLYENLRILPVAGKSKDRGDISNYPKTEKNFELEQLTSTNMENIGVLAEAFLKHHQEYVPWFVDCCNGLELSKTLFFLILLQLCMMPEKDAAQFSALIAGCLPVLESEWEKLQSENVSSPDKFDVMPYQSCKPFVERLCDANISELNTEILVYIFLRLPDALSKTGASTKILQDVFVFFSSQRRAVFKEHIHCFVSGCTMSMCQFLLNLITEEGPIVAVKVGSLASVAHLCTTTEGAMTLKLLTSFPAVLVPLSHDSQEVRVAAMSCLEGLHLLWERADLAKSRNGSSAVWIDFLGELLNLIVQQKRMILSDRNFLSSLFTSLVSSSPNSLLVHQNIGKRFDESTKNDILVFILGSALGLSAYAKLKILSLLKGLGSRILRIRGVEMLLNDLLKRRLCDKLSKNEVGILCVLLEICCKSTSSLDSSIVGDSLLKALQLNSVPTEDHAVIEPCLTVLRNVNSSFYGDLKVGYQDLLLRALVFLFRSNKAEIQNATKEALLRMDIDCTTICRIFKSLGHLESDLTGLQHGKKKKNTHSHDKSDICSDGNRSDENSLVFIGSLLDVVLLKKGMQKRTLLVEPLFCLLQSPIVNGGLLLSASEEENDARNLSDDVVYIQQTVFLLLEDIISSTINDDTKMVDINESDIKLLISCARTANDTATRNHAFSLLAAIAKVLPDKVVEHILDILVVTGESAVAQWDRQSQRVYEDLISAVVPCWLSKSDDLTKLLQIFVDVLPQVSEHRRVSVVVPLLRNLGEPACVGSLLFLLFQSLSSTNSLSLLGDNELPLDSITSLVSKQWEYLLAMQLTEQYSSMIWLPSVELLLQQTGNTIWTKERFMELVVAMKFITDKLEDPELIFRLDSGKDSDSIQKTLGGLMEQVIYHRQMIDLRKKQIDVTLRIKKELKEYTHSVMRTIMRYLMPSSFFKLVTKLLGNSEKSIRKKALMLLSESVKFFGANDLKHVKRGMNSSIRSSWLQLDDIAQDSFKQLFLEILNLLDDSKKSLSSTIETEAVSTLEVVCSSFPVDPSMLSMCLRSICRKIGSEDPSISSCCLRATGSLINLLGPKALSELPGIMKSVLKKAQDIFSSGSIAISGNDVGPAAPSHMMDSLFMAILITLEETTDKIGGFLNPYLEDILRLVVLRPEYTSASDPKLKARADVLRKLMTHKIPVRLLLPPLLTIYSDAIEFGESSLSIVFEMLGSLVGTMDRSSIGAYHAKIFDLGLLALDLRGQNPASVKDVDVVEKCVLEAITTLTLKLTETMFRPLFIKSIEWSALNMMDGDTTGRKKFDRIISFYGLVNKLAESHRSLFVPYFKYLLDGCVHYLTYTEDAKVDLTRKKKRAKLQDATSEHKDTNRSVSLEIWRLRALILSSLYKCFLYDTGSLKFLDSSNFQVLLKPIVSQLVIEPPACLDQYPNVPSVKEVDNLLVACVGQMAVTAGSDLLWKPLNHEVLMQTRDDKIRPRMLALQIVKYFVKNLKEEYLALLAETIPFLGELLEDAELSVKSLAQEILKEMETLSGESLREYL
ncbi:RNA metabolism protein [Lithospermum erythrorhizon]|uniref:RNA metabolism protein n=1 Tax=Lithospermum erythrorhizon TaxID=34254 RepID=A0AAV3PF01_LITER